MVETLAARNIWPEITGFGRLLERTLHEAHQLSTQPITVLHNDVYPPNCGIPVNMSGETILLDWEMVGWGLEELDLAFMFLQPYGSHLELDRAEALSYYWRARQRLGCPVRSSAEHQIRQRYADALWTLWLIPVAYHMAMSPYPIGSSPRIYWNAMFKVLGARLQSLSSAA